MTKVLIIEDDFALADNLKALLELKGFRVEAAADGPTGVERAKSFMPDVVLLDLMIPRVSGFEVCRTLRSDPKTAGMKIIITTGLDKIADVEKAYSAGAADYLTKPYDSDRLLKKINKVLGK